MKINDTIIDRDCEKPVVPNAKKRQRMGFLLVFKEIFIYMTYTNVYMG